VYHDTEKVVFILLVTAPSIGIFGILRRFGKWFRTGIPRISIHAAVQGVAMRIEERLHRYGPALRDMANMTEYLAHDLCVGNVPVLGLLE